MGGGGERAISTWVIEFNSSLMLGAVITRHHLPTTDHTCLRLPSVHSYGVYLRRLFALPVNSVLFWHCSSLVGKLRAVKVKKEREDQLATKDHK